MGTSSVNFIHLLYLTISCGGTVFIGGGRGGTAKNFPYLTYFLLDIFNTRAGFLSSFLNFFSKFAQFLYIINFKNFGILSIFGGVGSLPHFY